MRRGGGRSGCVGMRFGCGVRAAWWNSCAHSTRCAMIDTSARDTTKGTPVTHTTACLARVNKSFDDNRRDALADAAFTHDETQTAYILGAMSEDNRPAIVNEWLRDGTATCTCPPEPAQQWALIIIPGDAEISPYLLAEAIRHLITDTEEASEDVTVSVIAGIVLITAWWAGQDWCQELRDTVTDTVSGVKCWVASHR